jgi:hypothetical protein
MISFDGTRLVYVSDLGSFTLYTYNSSEEMYAKAEDGMATLASAEVAVVECAGFLAEMLEMMSEVA